MFNEVWVPYSLADLPDEETLSVDDADEYIEYLTEKWPADGKPHRVEFQRGPRKPPPGVDGWIVFRLPPREPAPVDPSAPVIDWDSVLRERTRDQPED